MVPLSTPLFFGWIISLKVVGIEKGGCQEAGKCSKMVSDRGDLYIKALYLGHKYN
jgi:hypothetical protein